MRHYDVIVIGAGPGGIFATYELAKKQPELSIAVFEAGHKLSGRKCPIDGDKIPNCINCKSCSIMSGFGGAGAFSDGKYNITNDFGGTLYEHIGKKQAIELMKYVDEINMEHGGEGTRLFSTAGTKFKKICMQNKLKLYGFNNLTKALSFNIYDVCYAKTEREQRDYIKYIDQQYNSERLTGILERVTEMIGAHVLHISKQDYDPQGASVTFLIAEEHMKPALEPDTIVAHLDKSHVTVHTYPEYHPDTCLATFRVDIDVATCGEITPLSTLDYLIGSFDSDIITMDYRVRGFTRDIEGKKLFMDHHMTSIQDFIDPKTLERYDAYDINVYQSNLFHTRMLLKEVDLQNYLFNTDIYELPPKTRLKIHSDLRREMIEIFSGKNIY